MTIRCKLIHIRVVLIANRGGGPLFIAYVEDFVKQYQYPPTNKTIVLIDNASFHKSADVKAKIKEWQKRTYFFSFFGPPKRPPYCSELNPIEILWHHIKHLWLKIEDYTSAETLKNAVESITTQVGNKYTITFA